ncbi:MAG: hypothetical protein CMH46_02990 [Muricauda sp.]|nr:hypothetical protein [Allomuricauda sp.]
MEIESIEYQSKTLRCVILNSFQNPIKVLSNHHENLKQVQVDENYLLGYPSRTIFPLEIESIEYQVKTLRCVILNSFQNPIIVLSNHYENLKQVQVDENYLLGYPSRTFFPLEIESIEYQAKTLRCVILNSFQNPIMVLSKSL